MTGVKLTAVGRLFQTGVKLGQSLPEPAPHLWFGLQHLQ